MQKRIWDFLNSKVGILLLGFTMTTVVGGLFADWVQRRTWHHQYILEQQRQDFEWNRSRKFELLRLKLEEGHRSLEEISDLINLRFFRLQKVYEAIASGDLNSVDKLWHEYMLAVEQWNVKLIINQNKIERLVNNEAALQFNNYETDNPSISNPTSLHGRFYIVHKKIRTLVDCSKNKSCTITSEMKLDANKYLRELDLYSDSFVDNVSALFLKRTFELEEFQNIETANMANSADAKSRAAD